MVIRVLTFASCLIRLLLVFHNYYVFVTQKNKRFCSVALTIFFRCVHRPAWDGTLLIHVTQHYDFTIMLGVTWTLCRAGLQGNDISYPRRGFTLFNRFENISFIACYCYESPTGIGEKVSNGRPQFCSIMVKPDYCFVAVLSLFRRRAQGEHPPIPGDVAKKKRRHAKKHAADEV